MSSKTNYEDQKSLDRFQLKPFSGNKAHWMDFKFEVQQAINTDARTLENGAEYLFAVFPTNAAGERQIPERWALREEPEPLWGVAGANRERRAERGEEIKDSRARNKRNVELQAACSSIIGSRVDEAIKRDLLTVAGKDPNLAWHRLEELYGPASSGANDYSTAFQRVIAARMEPQERFSAWITQWDIQATYCDLSDDMRRAILLSDRSNVLRMQCLPDRLQEHVAYCLQHALSYAKTVKYLRTQDNRAHDAGTKLPGNKSSVKAVQSDGKQSRGIRERNDLLCLNCKNYCHSADNCRAKA